MRVEIAPPIMPILGINRILSDTVSVAAMSKENRGIFTVTYEYERMFDQQIQFLDKYCKIVAS